MKWLERARQRTLRNPITDAGSGPLVAGVDVGGGEADASSKATSRKSSGWEPGGVRTLAGGWSACLMNSARVFPL
jgi:hypothetical protein